VLSMVGEGWRPGARIDKGERWSTDELGSVISDLLAASPKNAELE